MNGKNLWLVLRGFAWTNIGLGVIGFFIALNMKITTEGSYTTYTEPNPDRWVIAFSILLAGVITSIVFFFLAKVLENSATQESILRDMLTKIESLERKAKF